MTAVRYEGGAVRVMWVRSGQARGGVVQKGVLVGGVCACMLSGLRYNKALIVCLSSPLSK